MICIERALGKTIVANSTVNIMEVAMGTVKAARE